MSFDPEIRPPFDELVGQELVARYLSRATAPAVGDGTPAAGDGAPVPTPAAPAPAPAAGDSAPAAGAPGTPPPDDQLAQAFLFTGPVGAGKTEAALLLAQSQLCPNGGADNCDECGRVRRRTHPDLHVLEPEGAQSYLLEQIAQLARDAFLKPMRARRKVYIIKEADRLSASTANAFLKLLEEPPPSVRFILIARTRAGVLDTIASRCQLVSFVALSEVAAINILAAETGANDDQARIALSVGGGSVSQARSYINTESRRAFRREVIGILSSLERKDAHDLLEAAKKLVTVARAPLDSARLRHAEELEAGKEQLSKGALSSLEQRQKRELSALERRNVIEVLNVLRSWYRDALLIGLGRAEDCVNRDVIEAISLFRGRTSEAACLRLLGQVDQSEKRLQYNVSVQSVFESLLFEAARAVN